MVEEVPSTGTLSLSTIAETVRRYWTEERIPSKLVAGPAGGPVFRFTEGPPTANGPPHMGHVVARTLKDAVLRYKRMRGYRIVSAFGGWDCHGLPVEIEVEKRLGFKSKREIEAYGIDRFSEACRASVFVAVSAWREMSDRLGYWLDYDRAYITMNAPYIESVWWSLKTLFDTGFLERGHYVLPYCPRCETPLSSHEVAQGYRETTDPSITVRLPVDGSPGGLPRYLLVWTTTPWTLPANLLVAARADLPYVAVEVEGAEYLLAEAAVARYFPEGAKVAKRLTGKDLAGIVYRPPFPFAEGGNGRFRVVLDDMVDAKEGTGLVHIAPSFGVDDQRIGARERVGVFDPLDNRGAFTDRVPFLSGRRFKEADGLLLADLETRGLIVKRESVRHTYPFCWRCDNPLIYRAIDSWFVRTSKQTAQLVENNRSVLWVPSHMRDGRFGNFLTEAKDWALSRNRYWGTPLPIWTCPNGHSTCVGSFAELSQLTGADVGPPFDPHRVTVDQLTMRCTKCGQSAQREPYTIDGWYDSGAAPFAQYHYPFEPGPFVPDQPLDFIAEGLDQTRGWFYTLLVEATLLFHRPAYRVCVVDGLVLHETGQKMSKSRGNVLDPMETLAKYGGDSLRWTFLTSDFTEPMRVSERTIEQGAARGLTTLAHVVSFYRENAVVDGLAPAHASPQPASALDRWLLARLAETIDAATSGLEQYDLQRAAQTLHGFIDELSQWYLRRSRPRFWGELGAQARREANDTLSFVLLTYARLLAPFAPFLSEWVFQEVGGGRFAPGAESVHSTSWPETLDRKDPKLLTAMSDLLRTVEAARELRHRAQVKSRIPLPTLVVGPGVGASSPLGPEGDELLAAELNVRSVQRAKSSDSGSYPDSDWVRKEEEGRLILALSRRPTPELRQEGLVREALRRLQNARKELGLRYSDRIRVDLFAEGELLKALAQSRERLARELLADRLTVAERVSSDPENLKSWDLDGLSLRARIERSIGATGT